MGSVHFSVDVIDFSEIYLEKEHRDKDIIEKIFGFLIKKILKKRFILKPYLFSFTWTRCSFGILLCG